MTVSDLDRDTTRGSVRRRRFLLPTVIVALVVVLALAGTYLVGYRVNLTTSQVVAPGAEASPDQVITAYVDAYNHRDWTTMAQIYPSQRLDRHRAIGTMSDLTIVRSQAVAGAEDGNPAEPGRSYYQVQVTLDLSGLTGSDLAYEPGPNGWTYSLGRDSATDPWQIVDHGKG